MVARRSAVRQISCYLIFRQFRELVPFIGNDSFFLFPTPPLNLLFKGYCLIYIIEHFTKYQHHWPTAKSVSRKIKALIMFCYSYIEIIGHSGIVGTVGTFKNVCIIVMHGVDDLFSPSDRSSELPLTHLPNAYYKSIKTTIDRPINY